MEVLEKQPEKGFVDPSPGLTAQRERSGSVKEFRTEKLSFQQGMPVLLKIQEVLLRCDEPFTACAPDGQCFKVRSSAGWIAAHCPSCYRAGFVTEVPA